ncbi:hyaluronate lyase [Microbacterium resistens]|uniref:Hyaluronate lyase n=1 Tax=Microbacterium resistens TaxID=156977 RepID=A0ABU1SD04_9MICO|nr:polysaccharide lyase 8 family protein [Microbacterium resistens]MDR6867485.1 hyaluronate lyase [Microbacterium resistens]
MSDPFTWSLSRRRLLQAALVGGAATWLVGQQAWPAAAAGDDFETVMSRWTILTTGSSIDPSDPDYASGIAQLDSLSTGYMSTYQATGTELWSDLPLTDTTPTANISGCAVRLNTIAMAVVTPGTSLYGSATATSLVMDGIHRLCTGAYSPAKTRRTNWWDWTIGTPQALTSAAVYLRSSLPASILAELRASVVKFADPLSVPTGANYTDEARIQVKLGALDGDATRITQALSFLGANLAYRTDGTGVNESRDGLHPDGSYIQHGSLAYTGTYGQVFLKGVAQLAALTVGTAWAVTDPNMENMFVTAENGFVPMVWNGLMLDSVRGRAISRETETDAQDGLATAFALTILAQGDPDAARAAFFRRAAKGMLTRQTAAPYRDNLDLAGLATMKPLLSDTAIVAEPEPVAHHHFPDMARSVHRRSGWAASFSLSSDRIAYYESINGENKRGWHTGEGMVQIYLDNDNSQFTDNFWNTTDPAKLPGVTVSLKTIAESFGNSTRPDATWVGGSVLDGLYGAVGMQLKSLGTSLTAYKSWFCFDDAIVCLGSGITAPASTGAWVNTIVENRKLADPSATLLIDGTPQIPALGNGAAFTGKWAHLAGVGGYLMLDSGAFKAYRINRSGSWSGVNTGGSTTTVTKPYLQIFRDHSSGPTNATYAHAVLPSATSSATSALSASKPFTVVQNTTTAHAVTDSRSAITMANFYAAGTAGSLTASAPCSVVVQETATGLRVALSDPSRASTSVTLTITGRSYSGAQPADGVTVLSTSSPVQLQFDTNGLRGGSRQITLTL